MAAPRFAPVPPVDVSRVYESPPVVPASWKPDRPGDFAGFQPEGERLGFQGPDQGFALRIANGFRDRLALQPGERADEAIKGCLGVALKRASLFSRAPVVHDLTIAFMIFGFLDTNAPSELVDARRPLFVGLAHVYHYTEGRRIADLVPESTLRMTPQQVAAAYPARWRELVGL